MADIDFGNVAYPYITDDLLGDDADYRGPKQRRRDVLHALNEIRKIFVAVEASPHSSGASDSDSVDFSPPTP